MRGLSEQKLLRDLHEARLEVLADSARQLTTQGARLAQIGAPYDGRAIRTMLRAFGNQLRLACSHAENRDKGPLPDGLFGQFTEDRVDWDNVNRLLEEKPHVIGAMALVAMLAVIALMCAIDAAIRWGFARALDRRSCRIVATLYVDDRACDGLIVTLGRGGFRFQLTTGEDLPDGSTVQLQVRGHPVVDAVSTRTQADLVDLRFVQALRAPEHAKLLARSTISPFPVRKATFPKREENMAPAVASVQQRPP
ncbi:hypothetical protein [Sagittula sp. SSi028]|uniref:hypothetical protein n=1 Tax=Sagittula sp. SSi028 TaxID=3400636 RepID=UPI003AF601D8